MGDDGGARGVAVVVDATRGSGEKVAERLAVDGGARPRSSVALDRDDV